jgi:hypothetical protein
MVAYFMIKYLRIVPPCLGDDVQATKVGISIRSANTKQRTTIFFFFIESIYANGLPLNGEKAEFEIIL